MRTDPRFQKWLTWLDVVRDDLHHTYLYRDIFLGTIRVVEQNPRIDRQSFFFGFFQSVYVDSVVMAIRRQLKLNKDSISLAGLLTDVAEAPHLVTRAEYRGLYGSSDLFGRADREFSAFALPEQQHIDPAIVLQDLAALKQLASAVEEYADRRVAHWDKRALSTSLTSEALFSALDELGRLVAKYFLLFHASSLDISPFPQGPVFHIFKEPWIPQSSSRAGGA